MKMRTLAVAAAALTMAGMAHAQDMTSDKGKLSYIFGYRAGAEIMQYVEAGEQVDNASIVKGVQDALARKPAGLTEQQVGPTIEAFQKRMQQRQAAAKAAYDKDAAANKTKSDQFMAANKTKPGVTTLPGGVQYRVITRGTGAKPTMASNIAVAFAGPFFMGERPAGAPQLQDAPAMKLSEVQVTGLREAIMQMPAGSHWEITLPPDKAFGADPRTGMPPNAAVQFEVKLNSVN